MSTSTLTHYHLYLLWLKPDTFKAAQVWMDAIPVADAGWDYQYASYIDGCKYPGKVYFKHESDYLVFRLKFRDLLKF
jgi:hypothetical protein